MQCEFQAPEYDAGGDLRTARFAFEGDTGQGWILRRNGHVHLELGPGYTLLRSESCGICATDLHRRHLSFPLPQVIGHEIVARDREGRAFALEINASHHARGLDEPCPMCDAGLDIHCPERLVLGINRLPGGFSPFILAPVQARIPLPEALPLSSAVLLEPFAAALKAVETLTLSPGDRVAVLGPKRLGMLVIAALDAFRQTHGLDIEIVALARHAHLRQLAIRLGADTALEVAGDGGALATDLAEIVVDTTGSPAGLALALRLARRELHVKSTHGVPACGLARLTQLVVDELSIAPLATLVPGDLPAAAIAWDIAAAAADGQRYQAAVVTDAASLDHAVRPDPASNASVLRPRGTLLVPPGDGDPGSELLRKIRDRGLRVTTSRCGDFRRALALMMARPRLTDLGHGFVSHRFTLPELATAFRVAATPACIKAVVNHAPCPWPAGA